jgi:hypothetical protein
MALVLLYNVPSKMMLNDGKITGFGKVDLP